VAVRPLDERSGVLCDYRGSWGLQIGVEGIDLVMIIQNDRECSA